MTNARAERFYSTGTSKSTILNTDRTSAPQRLKLFATLASEAAACTRCPAMCERTAVLSSLNGSIAARVMFIGEAPGRKGADRTRVPFSGDQSGKNLDRFIASIGLTREQIFITSAALCNPRTASRANRKPTQTEATNCSDFLLRTIELVDPRVIVTLGSVALDALKRIRYHELKLKDAGKIYKWDGRMLVPIYHPSPQVLASHRRETEQLRDYRVVARAIRQAGIVVKREGHSLSADQRGKPQRNLLPKRHR
jgi:uracil-DNA glycosylase